MPDCKPIAAYRKFTPIKTLAETASLPEWLTIAEIASLHPDGDAFARLLLAAHDVFLSHEFARHYGPENHPPPDPKFGAGLRGEALHGWEMLDITLDFDTPWEPVPSVGDPRNALLIRVHRDDLKAWLDWTGSPLPADAPLNAWWPRGGPVARQDRAPSVGEGFELVFEQRLEAFRDWLNQMGIPPEDFRSLKSRHGYTLEKIYEALKDRKEFMNQNHPGQPMGIKSFHRAFWKRQKIANLN